MSNYNISTEALLRIPGDVWVFWKDIHGLYLGCNERMAADLKMHSTQEIEGKKDYDLFAEKEEADFYTKCDQDVISTRIAKQFYDTATLSKNKKRICMVIKVPLIKNNAETIGVVGISYNLDNKHYKILFTNNEIDGIKFTAREIECIYYLIRGKTAREIANILNLSSRTIEIYIANIKTKMMVTTKSNLIEKIISKLLLY